MVKRYANIAFIYAVIAMFFGIFYREFTKLNHFTGQTNLSVMHTHYFTLGMFFFLILTSYDKNIPKSCRRKIFKFQVIKSSLKSI